MAVIVLLLIVGFVVLLKVREPSRPQVDVAKA
jgi:hypothetical protein